MLRVVCTLLVSWLVLGAMTSASADDSAVKVKTVALAEVAFHPQYSAPATVLSRNNSQISAEITGRIEKVLVDVGDRVEPAQPLIELDCRAHRLQLRQGISELESLKAQLDLARRQLKRAESLQSRNNISEEQFNQRQADVEILSARLKTQEAAKEQAALAVEKCVIKAPFQGVITQRQAQLGELSQPGAPLFQLAQTDHPVISAQLTLSQTDKLDQARDLVFTLQNKSYPINIQQVLPVIDRQSRSREVRLSFVDQNPDPGASGRLQWTDAGYAVPADLVVKRQQNYGLMVANDNQAHFVPLENVQEGRPAYTDLPETTLIITSGHLGLENGDPIRIE